MIAADMPGTIELTSIFHYNKNSRVVQEQIKGIEVMAVSYTHLDVYKRQLQRGSPPESAAESDL